MANGLEDPSTLAIKKYERPFVGSQGKTSWFETCATYPIPSPPKVDARSGELYLHFHATGVQSWLMVRGTWGHAEEGTMHPEDAFRKLHFRASGEPSWLKTKGRRMA
jgi:hypothetical protein